MDVIERKVESQIQFWSLLGPFFVLLSTTVLLFKVSSHWYFPVSALIGIPLCVKWKMKGMATALCCLFLLVGISYQYLDLDDRYWHVGLSLAMAFSFIVLTLSWEEVQGAVNKVQLESQSRLDNFLLLDEKWKIAEQEWLNERQKAQIEITSLSQESAKVQEDKQTFYKLAQLAKDELVQVREQHDQLLQDILYKKQHIAQLQERLEETEMTIQRFIDSDSEKQIKALTERVAYLERDKETFKAKMAIAQQEKESCQAEREQLFQELQACQEREKLCLMEQHCVQQDRLDQQGVIQSLQNKCAAIEQEKQTLIQSQNNLKQQYEQMCCLQEQYLENLKQAQYKIQILEVKLREEEGQREFLQLNKKELEKSLLDSKEMEQESFFQMQQELEGKNKILVEAQKEVSKLSSEINNQQIFFSQVIEQNQRLENFKLQLEKDLEQAQIQLQQAKQGLRPNDQQHIEKLPDILSNNSRIESMYIQLKKQFQEKCQVLDMTRRELFHVNEELLKCKKEYEEECIFDQPKNEKYLIRYIVKLDRHFEQIEKRYQHEIDEFTQLVEYLLQQIER